MNYKVIDVRWYSGRETLGIVLIDTGFGHKAYIGYVPMPWDEKRDAERIVRWGVRFTDADKLWPDIKEWAR